MPKKKTNPSTSRSSSPKRTNRSSRSRSRVESVKKQPSKFKKKNYPKTPPRIKAKATNPGKLRIYCLGGLEEVGRNMTVVEYENDIILIDMGLQFPEENMPGIDYIIPNVSSLRGKEKNIRGVVITHAHYDHIGAIPHLMPRLGNPTMYTGALSAGIIQKRNQEYTQAPKLNIIQINEKSSHRLGNLRVEFFRVNHSIPDSFGVVIKTPIGTIVHTGDFKFDHNPVNEPPADLNHLAKIGSEGILALMADSTDSEDPGHQISEARVGEEMEKIFEEAQGRIIIGTFASLLTRVQQIIGIAEKFNRRVYIDGRSMKNNIEIAHQLGYLKIKSGTLIEPNDFKNVPDSKIVAICTGAQGEQNASLMRIANNEHRLIRVKEGDTIIFSSSVIPGNERSIQNLKDIFYRQGASVMHYKMMDIHAGGHAKQEDLKLMLRLMCPQFFIPIEANYYMLKIHGQLAESVGVPQDNIFIGDNGQVFEFSRDSRTKKTTGRLTNEKVCTDYVMVDGLGVGDVSNVVLRERRQMAGDGMFVVIATVDRKTGQPIGNPDLISRGFVYMKENRELIEKTRQRVKKILKDRDPRTPANEVYLKNKIRNDIGEFLFKKTERRPMVLPVIINV